MIAFLDVDYRKVGAVAAAILAHNWNDSMPTAEVTAFIPIVEEYVPGEFYRRELPCLQAVLARCAVPPHLIVIDGYVWLGPNYPGLGARLHEALASSVPVVGVAKTVFKSAEHVATKVIRSVSTQPLWITAIGTDTLGAAEAVRTMHGPFRIPTLIRRADHIARTASVE